MVHYKDCSDEQGRFVSIHFDKQIQVGTLEYTLNHLVEHELDLSVFDERFKNDDTGALAYGPRILSEIMPFAYSRGLVSKRKIKQACQENAIFIAVCADSRLHLTSIAGRLTQS